MDAAMLGRVQQHLSSGGQLSELLPDLDPSNPAVGLVSQMLAQRQQRLESQLEQFPADDPVSQGDLRRETELEAQRQAEAMARQERQQRRMEKIRRRFEEMDTELRWSRDLLDDLAQALGACPTCWGENPHCRLCRGRGRPGFLAPEPETFHRFVTPVLQGRRVVPSPTSPAAGPIPPERTTP